MTTTEDRRAPASLTMDCDWYQKQARPKQIIPQDGAWHTFLLWTERAWGKNRTAAEWLVHAASAQPNTEWAFVARDVGGLKSGFHDSGSGLVPIADSHRILRSFSRHDNVLRLTNGSAIHGLTSHNLDRLRGCNLAGAFLNDVDRWYDAEQIWNYGILPYLRMGPNPRVVVTASHSPNPSGAPARVTSPLVRNLLKLAREDEQLPPAERSYRSVGGCTWENLSNLGPQFLDRAVTIGAASWQ